jgi:ankyrin repeat protein
MSACDATRWAKSIAEIRAAEPERDAEQQVAAGNISLKRLKRRAEIAQDPLKWRAVAVTRGASVIETTIEFPDGRLQVDRRLAENTPGVVCHPNLPVAETFPIVDDAQNETTESLDKRCNLAALILADDYLRRFNQRVVGHPAHPHRDLCWVVGDKNASRGIAYRPNADVTPTNIPDVATAARFGLTDRVVQFIAEGADIGQTDIFGFDALKWAVVRDYRPIIDLLMAAGGKPDFCAALGGAVALARIEAIAVVAARCASHEQRLQFLVQAMNTGGDWWDPGFYLHINGGSEPVVRALLDAEPAPLLLGSKEIGSALLTTRLEFARLVLDRAAGEPNRVDEWWDALLARALVGWRLEIVELLLERGARPGPEAVPYAVERRAPNVVELLARHGADLNQGRRPPLERVVHTNTGLDPFGRPQPDSNSTDARRVDPPIFLALDPLTDFRMVDLLLQLGADPNVRDHGGRTPLMVAITDSRIYGKKNGIAWIEWYVPQHLIKGQEDWAHRGVEPVLALLAKGADVGLADSGGLTALHYAARSDYNAEIAQILLEHGADINARDASGRTPLDYAQAAKLVRMPGILAAAGARRGAQ